MKTLVVIGAIIAVIAYSCYYFLACYSSYFCVNELTWNLIHYLGLYASFVLIFIWFSIKEKNRILKFLVFVPMIGFFSLLIFIYLINNISDVLIKMNKPLLATIISITISIIWYLTEKLILWIRSLT